MTLSTSLIRAGACALIFLFAIASPGRFPLFDVTPAYADGDGGDGDGGDGDGDGGDGDGDGDDDDGGDDDDDDDDDDQDDDDEDDDDEEDEGLDPNAPTGGGDLITRVEPNEILGLGVSISDRVVLSREGFRLIAEEEIDLLSGSLIRFAIPAGLDPFEAAALARTLAPNATFDAHHLYEPSRGAAPRAYAAELISTAGRPRTCRVPRRIGIVDTALDDGHPAFANLDLGVERFSDRRRPASDPRHGTAVASLLVGQIPNGPPPLLRPSGFLAADPFHGGAEGDQANAMAVALSLDWLLRNDVRLIGMSLAGGSNLILKQAVQRAQEQGAVLIAAAGNDGARSTPRYPAGYAGVLAVTAIDERGRAHRPANRGDHLDFAAPGVGVWAAAVGGGGDFFDGTSFATPYVLAAAAVEAGSAQRLNAQDLKERLAAKARDLGAEGKDAVFGWGLVQIDPTLCR